MPNDNALLPPTIHLGYLPDDRIISHLRSARESIRFVGPGLSVVVARTLAERWNELGPGAVEVVLDEPHRGRRRLSRPPATGKLHLPKAERIWARSLRG